MSQFLDFYGKCKCLLLIFRWDVFSAEDRIIAILNTNILAVDISALRIALKLIEKHAIYGLTYIIYLPLCELHNVHV